ncbi:WD40-repeat-containing domain protein [Cladochytrium replicatum]|nr:WD40-repeat-containing domain protein [Cladochytrium replicatum]
MDGDAMREMLPMAFGKSKSKAQRDFSASKRTVSDNPETQQKPSLAPPAGKKVERNKGNSSAENGDFGPAPPPPPPADASPKRLERSVNNLVLEENEFGPTPPPPRNQSDDDSDDTTDDGEDDDDILPFTHEIKLMDHTRAVCAIGLDPSGSRMVTSGRDCVVKMWDFAGMDNSLRPFKSFEPSGGNPIREMNFNLTGETFMIASAEWVPKLYHRDGNQLAEFAKGDMYIRDRRHTHGHVAALTTIKWHPSDKQTFLTAAADSTVRIWDIEDKRGQKSVIVVKSKIKGGVTPICSANFSHDGKLIAAGSRIKSISNSTNRCLQGGEDGVIRLWKVGGQYINPTYSVEGHAAGEPITSLTFSVDNHSFLSRSTDSSVKLWDIRNFRAPVHTATSLPTSFEENNAIFSPDEQHVLTGTDDGVLVMLSRQTFAVERRITIDEPPPQQTSQQPTKRQLKSAVLRVIWHKKLNQVIVGMSRGSVHMLYDPNVSINGAKLCAGKEPKRLHAEEDVVSSLNPPIISGDPEDEEEQRMEKRKRNKLRRDLRPDAPITGPGRGGKVGTNLTQHIMRGIIKDTSRDSDPREAFLRHATDAESDPYWVNPAYKKTQPKPVYAEAVFEDEDEEKRESLKKRKQ